MQQRAIDGGIYTGVRFDRAPLNRRRRRRRPRAAAAHLRAPAGRCWKVLEGVSSVSLHTESAGARVLVSAVMSATEQPAASVAVASGEAPKKKRICCACPDTKALRDACVVQHGPEDKACAALVEAHNQCLRAEGFNV